MATIFKRGGKSNRNGRWFISWFDHTGKRRTVSARTADKAAADRIAAKLEGEAALRRTGIIDPALEAFSVEARRPLAEHVDAYKAKLTAAGRSEIHVSETIGLIRKIVDACKFVALGDLRTDPVNAYAASIRDGNRSARTVQKHLTAIKSFTRWLADTGKLSRDPLASARNRTRKRTAGTNAGCCCRPNGISCGLRFSRLGPSV